MPQIRIGAEEHDLGDVQEHPGRYARALEAAKIRPGYAECCCTTGRQRPRVVIRRHRDIFLLARWPEEAHLHDKLCPFHRESGRHGKPGTSLDAFRQQDGVHDIRLDLSMAVNSISKAHPTRVNAAPTAARTQRRSAGLLAFLEYAWERAGLNVWPGTGRRNWSACWSQLTTELEGCRINGADDTVLHVMQPWHPDRKDQILADLSALQARLAPTPTVTPRGIVVGEIESIGPSKFGYQLVLRQSRNVYYLSRALYAKLSESYAPAVSAIGQQPERRALAVLAVELTAGGNRSIVDMAAMLANRDYLPCDSSFEVEMADHLISHGRAFEKPVRHVDRKAVHPDFVLSDCASPAVIEVLGMSGNAVYDARQAEKRAYYRREGIACIEWTPSAQPLASLVLPPVAR
ncbi:DUF1173 family protein [Cupriavidus sp. CV2]|uniref:DUF1173 family protein n=1 Tax=Cupriavidus ulmosensis TaxID=3065913 RepID=UPI00296B2ADD|nr:DUF1173 family protein [Cupriavidus sp. CV2]MDW3683228.1 DUF1173 family protein [Cupriavidus sp. CV2]